jgi:hypothetical protein
MSVPPNSPNGPGAPGAPNNPDPIAWVSLDELLLGAGVDLRATRAWLTTTQVWNAIPTDGGGGGGGGGGDDDGGDGGGGGGGGGHSCCCCCCCCCCKHAKPKPEPDPGPDPDPGPPPPVRTEPPTVTMSATWELLVDPARIHAGVQALRGEVRWRARGPQATQVSIEARTEDRDGSATGPYPDWTTIVRDRSLVDVATTLIERSSGHVFRLRAKASAPSGDLGYSEVLTIRAPG